MVDEPRLSRGYASLYVTAGLVAVVRAVCISVGTASQHDIYTEPAVVELSSNDAHLGAIIRHAVSATRLIAKFSSPSDPQYESQLAQLLGLNSTRNMCSGMKSVLVRYLNGEVEFSPMRRLRGGYFEGFSELWPQKKAITIPFGADDQVWGASAREAIEKAV